MILIPYWLVAHNRIALCIIYFQKWSIKIVLFYFDNVVKPHAILFEYYHIA